MHVAALMIVLCQVNPAKDVKAHDVPAHMSSEQVARMRILVHETELRDIELQTQLKDLQAQLTDAYATFDVDIENVMRLQQQIAATQNELLLNYHKLQVGFRRIVGPDRFPFMKERIDHYIATTDVRRKKEQQQAVHAAQSAKTQPTSKTKSAE